MTENEIKNAIEVFEKPSKHINCVHKCENGMEFLTYSQYLVSAFETAIDGLKELQQYQAIGTVGRFQQLTEQFKPHVTDKTSCPNRGCNKCDMYRKENEKYHEIGAVEECRAARERQKPKKPIMKPFYEDMEEEYLCCPACGDILTDRIPMDNKDFYFHCLNCGQKLDWSE